MKKRMPCNVAIFGICLALVATATPRAAEIITKEDITQRVVTEEHLVRVADNALFLFDSSRSMRAPYLDTGMTRYEAVIRELKARNSYMPQIGHNFGLYLYTPWTEVYPMQKYDRDAFAAALDTLPDKAEGKTLLRTGLREAEEILKTLSGKTALIVFTDGSYTGDDRDQKRPIDTARRLLDTYDVCIYVISTAREKRNIEMVESIAALNSCSRVIPLTNYLGRPEYSTGALFEVKATEKIVTTTEKRIAGLVADNVTFDFNKDDIRSELETELGEVGTFLQQNPKAFVALHGYTDNVGSKEYNLKLSFRRAERVAGYLEKEFGIDRVRMVLQWYGFSNPIASNDSEEGRARNRRVEMAVGGL